MKQTSWKSLLCLLMSLLMLIGTLAALPLSIGAATTSTLTNLFDPNTAAGGFYRKNSSTGKADFVATASHYTSGMISVTAGDVITFGPAKVAQDFHMNGFDANGNVVEHQIPLNSSSKLKVVTYLNSYNGTDYAIYSYTVPAGVTQVHVTNYKDMNKIFTVTKNQAFDAEGLKTYWTSDTTRSQTFAPFASMIPNTNLTVDPSKDTGSILFGRSALFVGDSITYGSFDSATYKSWAGRIGQKHYMNYVNAGVGGASISNCRAAKPTQGRIITQLEKHEGEAFEYVIMHGGVNDAWDQINVGTVSDSFEYSTFKSYTFAGGLEQTFYRAKELFPDATYGFIMNFALPKCEYGNISDMSEYMAIAKEICEKWGVSYLDLYNDTEFCYNVLKVDTATYFGDTYYCHPNAAGHDLIAPKVEAWMETLPPAGATLGNVFDPAIAMSGHYHPTSGEKMESNYVTDKVAVKEGDVITFGPVPRSGQDFFLVGRDASGKILSTDFKNKKVLKVVDQSFRNHFLYSYTVPAGVTEVLLTVHNDLKAVYVATKNQPFDAFSFHTYWTEDEARATTFLKTKRSDSRLDGYSGQPYEVNKDSILYGRSVLFLGDSIVSAQRDTSLFYAGWSDRIGLVNKMNYINAGVSGTTMSTKSSYGTIVSQLTARREKSFDYIITNGGINDAYFSAPVGKMSSSKNVNDFDTSTFAGGLEHFFYTAKEKYPDALIGYICSHSTPKITNGRASNMTEYYTVAKQICEKWGVYCLDIYNNTEFCNNVLKTSEKTYMDDYLHPNGAGNDLIYPLVEEWMKSMPHPDNPVDEPPVEDEIPNTEDEDNGGEETLAPETDAPAQTSADTTEATEEGCGSAVAPMTAALLSAATAGAAMTLKKKKKEDQ